MPLARVHDSYSTVAYGRHHALLLTEGRGRPELDAALNPLPRRSGWIPIEPGDPFEDRERPLYLAVASDCASLSRSTLTALIRLGRLPGVRVDLMPGLPDAGADGGADRVVGRQARLWGDDHPEALDDVSGVGGR